MADAESQETPMRMKTIKIMMLGDSQVGKSSMIYRYVNGVFTSTLATTGIDFKTKTIDVPGQKIKLQIWDTAGQERFHAITTPYYRGAAGIMLVYDITDSKSFDNIANWLRNIDEYANKGVQRIILGNKCDMTDKRVVSKEQGEAIARKHKIRFFETSAKDNTNVDTAFYALVEAVLDKPSKDPRGAIVVEQSQPRGLKRRGC